jgi:hypothetical protein
MVDFCIAAVFRQAAASSAEPRAAGEGAARGVVSARRWACRGYLLTLEDSSSAAQSSGSNTVLYFS